MQEFEKLGIFYLGRPYDVDAGVPQAGYVLYDSRDLVTHAVCVGMTGSGKTGLCIGLIEEATIDGIPVIAIDPKGDLPNLLLTFPNLQPSDFEPWINPDDASRRNLSAEGFAAEQAQLWRNGLADWRQDGARIQRLRDAAEFAVYTPGSAAGLPLSILQSLSPPPPKVLDDPEALADALNTIATSLMTLAGVEGQPGQSREHLLLTTIIGHAWRSGQAIDLPGLIQQVQRPPVSRVGLLELDAFYPADERFALANRLNQVLAAPGFDLWLTGEPLDVSRLLYTAEGRPRVSILSIAHLNDAERMSFVSLLLGQVVAWMRGQSGTASLRALLYLDEIAGFFPPVANPPAKAPLLTLLKQGRAFGLGVVLATQTHVDLDYKGLANAGTWFVGRLQTDRDRARVLDGLEGIASHGFDRAALERTLAGLSKRIFILHNVHETAPVIFETRWTLSYLRGPMTREHIRDLMDGQRRARGGSTGAQVTPPVGTAVAPPTAAMGTAPVLPPDVPQYFLPIRRSAEPGESLRYEPMLFVAALVEYTERKLAVNETREIAAVTPITRAPLAVEWESAQRIDVSAADLETDPRAEGTFGELPAVAIRSASYPKWAREFSRWVSQSQALELSHSPTLELTSRPGETDRDFRIRLRERARELTDAVTDRLRQKYARKVGRLEERLRKAEMAVARESEQATHQKLQTAVSLGATMLGAILGRRTTSSTLGRATTTARGVGRSMKDAQDVKRAEEDVASLRAQLADLEAQVSAEIDDEIARLDPDGPLQRIAIRPSSRQVGVQLSALAWAPCWVGGATARPAWGE